MRKSYWLAQIADALAAGYIRSATHRTATVPHTKSLRVASLGAVALTVLLSGLDVVQAQSSTVVMTPPTCEAYQRQRPRGGDPDQLSDLFSLLLYRWSKTDYLRYRDFLLDCKRSLPRFREELTMEAWEETVAESITRLMQYSGYLNELREPMADRRGPRPVPGEPDYTLVFRTMGCDRFNRQSVSLWARGGMPDATSAAPFSVPLAAWHYEVWRAFENRVKACVQLPGSEAQTERDWLHTLVTQQESGNSAEIRQVQQDLAAGDAKLNGILARVAEAEGLQSADEIAIKLKAIDALAASGPSLAPKEDARIARARERLTAQLKAARTAEAEAWERDRPAREARAREQDEELANLQRRNREQEAETTAERERNARIETERQVGARAQAEREAAEVEAQRQRDVDERAAKRQAQERADAENLARLKREDEAALARDPCNRVEVRRQLMDAANAMDRGRFGSRKLLDLRRGRTNSGQPDATRACVFEAEWSSGQRGLVTITVRKNSFGEDLIEVRPY